MIAIILSEKHECQNRLVSTRVRLAKHGIHSIVIGDIWEMEKIIPFLSSIGDKPFLFLKSPWDWVDLPQEILSFHAANLGFESIVVDGEEVTYIPSRVTVFRDGLINVKNLHGDSFFNFTAESNTRSVEHPAAKPRIFLTTHNRHVYLELTLNSLFHNLKETTPVTLLLNEPSQEVSDIALKMADRRKIDILKIERNSFYSSINLAVQWYNPEVFMIFEDDFILSPTAHEYYPNWEYHFARRTEDFDLVGWSPILDNGPTSHRFPRIKAKPFGQWHYGDKNEKPLLLGNALMVRKTFWLDALKSDVEQKWYTPLDHTLHRQSKRYCLPALRGYHIGWNQKVDCILAQQSKDFEVPLTNKVTNVQTGESRLLHLPDILL